MAKSTGIRIAGPNGYIPLSEWDFGWGKGVLKDPKTKGVDRPLELNPGPPPQGTYDSALDYNSGAANRGFLQTTNDANTAFEQGQQDYGIGLGDLQRTHDYAGQDLDTSLGRLKQDYGLQTDALGRQYGILGRQQAEGARQRGVTSAGLLGQSNAVRAANQQRDQYGLDLSQNRGIEDINTNRTRVNSAFDRGKLGLDVGNARTFGGFNGSQIINPLTGQPETGSLLTGVQRAFTENDAYQQGILGQKTQQAQANGYISPLLNPPAFDPEEYKKKAAAFLKAQGH